MTLTGMYASRSHVYPEGHVCHQNICMVDYKSRLEIKSQDVDLKGFPLDNMDTKGRNIQTHLVILENSSHLVVQLRRLIIVN